MQDLEFEESGNVVTIAIYAGIAVATAAIGFVGGALFSKRKTKQLINEKIIKLAKANELKLPKEFADIEAQLKKRGQHVRTTNNKKTADNNKE